MTRIVVIGGGVIGASTAFRLAQAGAEVTLLEAGTIASGTSSTSFAWMNSNNKAPIEYHLLNVGGMTEHARLAEELGHAPWLHINGNVIWGGPEGANEPAVPVQGESFDQKIRRLRDWGYPVEILTRRELASIHPEITPQRNVERVAYFPTEGYIDVPLLVATLVRAATANGADIRTNQKVVEIMVEHGRAAGVRTATGETYAADVIVSCAGRWTDEVAAQVDVAMPMAPTLGLLVNSTPVPTTLRALVHTTDVNLRPDGGSRLLMASFQLDDVLVADMSRETLQQLADEILERAKVVLPDLAGGSVESFRVGVRSIPRDGFPIVGPVPGVEGLYVVATHSGVTMGPFLGRIVANEILTGHMDERISCFRVDQRPPVARGRRQPVA